MSGFLHDATGLLDHYGYFAVAVLVLLEDFGLPVPGETVLILAAARAGTGHLSVLAVAGVAWPAAVIGDNIGYLIGRSGARRLIDRYGRYVLLTPERMKRAEGFFGRAGGRIVLVARFIEGLRQLNGIAAGSAGMAWRRFLVFNAIGAALWVGVWTILGYLLGDRVQAVEGVIRRYEWYLLGAAAVLLVGYLAVRLRRRSRSPR